MGKNCCFCRPKTEYVTKVEYKYIEKEKPVPVPVKDPSLFDDLKGKWKNAMDENSTEDLSSESSNTSNWTSSNPDHFEINIRLGSNEKKLKVKSRYKVSKVINKIIELEHLSNIEGKLYCGGKMLDIWKTLKELGISQDNTLVLK